MQQHESGLTNTGLKGLAGSDDIAPEAHRIVIARVERQPCNRKRILAFATRGNPLAHERGFAKAGRSREQGKLIFKRFIKPGEQRLT